MLQSLLATLTFWMLQSFGKRLDNVFLLNVSYRYYFKIDKAYHLRLICQWKWINKNDFFLG